MFKLTHDNAEITITEYSYAIEYEVDLDGVTLPFHVGFTDAGDIASGWLTLSVEERRIRLEFLESLQKFYERYACQPHMELEHIQAMSSEFARFAFVLEGAQQRRLGSQLGED